MRLDSDGQPAPGFNQQLRARRTLDELLGICRGMILDGEILETEATGLAQWLDRHPDAQSSFPANVIAKRLERVFADGVVDDQERADLLALMQEVLGADPMDATEADWSTAAIFKSPPPAITYPGHRFCFTGKFFYGTRRACERAVLEQGGEVLPGVTKELHYLVVGLLGSRNWVHSTHGTKIEKAIRYGERGLPLANRVGEGLGAVAGVKGDVGHRAG